MKPQRTAHFGAVRAVLAGSLRLWVTWPWLLLLAALAFSIALVASREADRFATQAIGRPALPAEIGHSDEMMRPAAVRVQDPVAQRIVWVWPLLATIGGCVTALVLAEHFAGYRWRLVPGYRPVCLAAGAIFGGTSLIVTGALLTLGSPERLAMSGLAILSFALGCWAIARPWAIPVCLAVLVIFTPLTGLFPDVATVFAAAATWRGAVSCAVAGGLLMFWFVRWLIHYNEDYPCHAQWRTATALWRSSLGGLVPGRGRQAAAPLKEGALLRWQDWWFERSLRRGPRGFAWTVRRWSLGALPIGPEIMLLLGIAAMLLGDLLFALFLPNLWPKSNGGGTRAMIIVWIGVLFLFRLIGFQRRPTLAIESLRPVTRTSWVFQSWAAILPRLAGVIAILAICTVAGVGPPNDGPPTGAGLPGSLACWFLSASVLVASVGLIAWLRTVGPLALEIVAAVVGFYCCLFPAMIPTAPAAIRADFGLREVGLLAASALGLLIVGVTCLRLAYRRWLTADLD